MDYRLLTGFEEYLKQKYQSNPTKDVDEIDLSSFNIFSQYSTDFKEYVEKEYGEDSSSVFGDKSVNEVDNNGKDSNVDKKNNDLSTLNIFESMMSKNIQNSTQNEDESAILESFQQAAELVDGNMSTLPDESGSGDIITISTQQNQTQPVKQNDSLSFMSDLNVDFSGSEKSVLVGLFDNDNDGILSNEEQAVASVMLKELSGDKTLNKEGINILKQYISQSVEKGLSDNDIIKNIKALRGNNEELEAEDFSALSEMAANGVLPENVQDLIDEGIQTNDVMESSGAGDVTTSPNGAKTPNSPASAKKNIQNMSIEDLEKELNTAKSNVQKAQSDYTKELEKVDAELAKKITDTNNNISDTQGELDTANGELQDKNSKLNGLNSDLSSAKSRVGDLDSQISSLESSKNSAKDGEAVDKAAIEAQISQLKAEKERIENETIPQIEEDIKATQEEIDKLQNETIPQLEEKLTEYKTQLEEYEQEASALTTTNPELKTMMDAYNEAVKYQDTVEQTLATRQADKAKEEQSNRPSAEEGPKDYRDKEGIDYTNLPMTYTVDGQEYHCVGFEGYDTDGDGEIDFKPDSWEEVQRYFANGGLMNLGKYGSMQCHNYSNVMVDFVMGTVNKDLLIAMKNETEDPNYGNNDTAGLYGTQREYNKRDCLQCKAPDRDAERAIIENELQNGRPCIVSVPYPGGSHYVAAVGIADNGDILIWDSYNGSMEKLGMSSNSDNNKLHRNMATGNGVMVLVNGSSYQYATAGWIDYWQDCVNQDPEHTIEVDKSHSKKKR